MKLYQIPPTKEIIIKKSMLESQGIFKSKKKKDNYINNNDKSKFNNNITLSVGKSSKLQNTKGPEKELILFVLKQTNSSVKILPN